MAVSRATGILLKSTKPGKRPDPVGIGHPFERECPARTM